MMAMPIMIQGTMSNVGKSILTAALCRIFKEDGFSVAPFKSQNMALNSFITEDGLEMGRAQVTQAEAAGIKPLVSMNPILLKPTNDKGSQVILNGKVFGNMTAKEYYENKLKFIPYIMEAYNFLSGKYDIIVIEGAGSPAEINLKEDDIVNMGMARLVKAPVLLVGDIDRGGVFAQLIGTIGLLEKDERKYVKGLIVNKFRGDKEIFKRGVRMLEEKAGKPVIGVIPYVHFDIDDEDSLSERFYNKDRGGVLDIVVIKLPRISNFTDFNAFERFGEVNLRYVRKANEIKDPDMVIIPGTKNTQGDLLWLRENGIEVKIKTLARKGKVIFGICGGFQMLGEEIYDEGSENKGGVRGMGLLPVKTNFMSEKTQTRVNGKFLSIGGVLKDLSGEEFEGYEIHMGVSDIIGDLKNMSVLYSDNFSDGKGDGISVGNVYGTYTHGIFDRENVIYKIISSLMREKGINNSSCSKIFNMREYKERQYSLLADTVRKNIDVDFIYKILRRGI